MIHELKKSLSICLLAAICLAGCAKQELVKQDPIIPAPASSLAPAPAKPAVRDAAKAPADNKSILTDTALGESTIKSANGEKAPNGEDNGAKGTALAASPDKVYFDFDSRTLSPAGRATLAKFAETLKAQGKLKIRIEGHCDETGSDEYNLALGEGRAQVAMNYLHALGIQSDRISIISYGKEKPAELGHDDAAMAKNRRDEFVVFSK
jgi:peptidoglycan-associated lipoprotein